MGVDIVEVALISTFLSLAISVSGAAFVASRNLGSSTLSLATAALAGTAVVFLLQTYFELRPDKELDHVSTNFTIDASAPSIRQWEYPASLLNRASVEINAGKWLKDVDLKAFDSNREKVFSDFAIFSFVSFLMTTEFDWQLRKRVYPAGALGTSTTIQPVSQPGECTVYALKDIREKLKAAGNLFSDAPIMAAAPDTLCLPPETRLEISPDSVRLENHFCRATWKLDSTPVLMSHAKPGTESTTGEMRMITASKPQFETRVSGFSVDVGYFRFRAKSLDMPKYKAWIERIISDSHEWFESQVRGAGL